MSENSEGEEIDRKGNEWEVVAITESVYAAAPAPKPDILDNSCSNLGGDDNAEYLPVEPEYEEKYCGKDRDHDVPQLMEQGDKSGLKLEEDLHIEGLISDEYPGASEFDEKGTPYMADEYSGTAESYKDAMDPGMSNVQKDIEEKSNELPNLPCEVWWKRHAASLYGHVKNTNPYWSIVVAAAVIGLVIIGRRWQQDKPQVFQLKSELIIDDEGFSHSQSH